MEAYRDGFIRTVERFEARLQRLSVLSLQNPEDDVDERAAMTVLLSGAFERFLQDSTREFVSALPSRVTSFQSLPPVVRRTHYEGGARILEQAAKKDWKEIKAKRASTFDRADDVVERLGAVGATPYHLVWEEFVRTDSNVSPDTVIAILRRVAVEKPWETLVGQIPPEAYTVPAAARAGKLHAALAEFRKARNRCAHGAPGGAVPQWSELLDFMMALKATALGYVAALEGRLASL
jgi:hypothetical protein